MTTQQPSEPIARLGARLRSERDEARRLLREHGYGTETGLSRCNECGALGGESHAHWCQTGAALGDPMRPAPEGE